jgi:ribosomal protein S18 acetylase RimI-like enzyme
MAGEGRVLVRRAYMGDAAALAEIHVRSWRATYGRTVSPAVLAALDVPTRTAMWRDRLERGPAGRSTYVLQVDGAVAGFVLVGPTPDDDHDPIRTGQVISLHVDPAWTGRGLGASLLAHAVDALAHGGYTVATLWVVSDNSGARRFYERADWKPDGTSRRETLAVEGEAGEEVTVVRYQRTLRPPPVQGWNG